MQVAMNLMRNVRSPETERSGRETERPDEGPLKRLGEGRSPQTLFRLGAWMSLGFRNGRLGRFDTLWLCLFCIYFVL